MSQFIPALVIRQLAVYSMALAAYFALMVALWAFGIEGIYAHPTPFYALIAPIIPKTPMAMLYLLLPIVVASVGGVFFARYLRAGLPGADAPGMTPMARRRFLCAAVVFYVIFACVVAMMRDGVNGISQAYARSAYEYAGDIGKVANIQTLFARYDELQPYLSMHAKVHPPGPIALLWIMSWFVTQDPLALSLATVFFAALALIPLFLWTRELFGEATAVIATALYCGLPAVVLFSATSADALFPPFTLATLYLFERGLHGRHAAAIAAGVGFALMSFLKYSLIGIGIYFAFAGLLALLRPAQRVHVFTTAALMLFSLVAVHVAVYLWSGFDIFGAFWMAKAQFDLDQHHLDLQSPRLAPYWYRILNPLCWFYFVGIPVALLCLRAWKQAATADQSNNSPARHRGVLVAFLLTAIVLNLLYLARGEGERSALYLYPFLLLPASLYLTGLGNRESRNVALLSVTVFIFFQTYITEFVFYSYW